MYYRLSSFDRGCDRCTLSSGKAVSGQSLSPFKEVALIVVSAYPGTNEVSQNVSLAETGKSGSSKVNSAGDFLALTFSNIFDSDPEFPEALKPFNQFVYKTNAIHCQPQKGNVKLTVTARHLKTCAQTWLEQELALFAPTTPLLLAGSEAVKALVDLKQGVYANRRKVLYVNQHPTVVTFNPIEAERGLMKLVKNAEETQKDLKKLFVKLKNPGKKIPLILKSEYWKPALTGTALWHFRKDMELIKQLVKTYYSPCI